MIQNLFDGSRWWLSVKPRHKGLGGGNTISINRLRGGLSRMRNRISMAKMTGTNNRASHQLHATVSKPNHVDIDGERIKVIVSAGDESTIGLGCKPNGVGIRQ